MYIHRMGRQSKSSATYKPITAQELARELYARAQKAGGELGNFEVAEALAEMADKYLEEAKQHG